MTPLRDETTTVPGDSCRSTPRKRFGLVQIYPRTPGAAPRVWSVDGRAHIGRSGECLVRIQDATVSRLHAWVEPTNEGLRVCDSGSRHGTFLEGQRMPRSAVTAVPGTVLRFGDTLLLAVEDPARYESPPRRLGSDFTGAPCDTWAGPDLWRVLQEAVRAGPLRHPVMVLGESGAGKEVVARLVHFSTSRPGKFVAVNLSAIPDGLFEAELFGYVRGAFTGATAARVGVFREASGGTLFLDELGDLRVDLQVKLLRVLESKRVRPLGADKDLEADPRLVTATSRDIEAAAARGDFRQDLYYRLSGVILRVPPLRERRDDVLMLASQRLADEAPGLSLSALAAEQLALGRWIGNVRELHYALARAVMRAQAESAAQLLPHHLPRLSEQTMEAQKQEALETAVLTPDTLRMALAHSAGNAREAATLLGVSRATLYNFCARQRLNLQALRVELRGTNGSRQLPKTHSEGS